MSQISDNTRRNLGLLIVFTLIIPATTIFALELAVDDFKLVNDDYDSIEKEYVFETPYDLATWMSLSQAKNPDIMNRMKCEKLASIEVKVAKVGRDFGSRDPFEFKARKRAAGLGANLLYQESDVIVKNTGRIASLTFVACRVQYKDYLLPPQEFASLAYFIQDRAAFESRVAGWNRGIGNIQEEKTDVEEILSKLINGASIQVLFNEGYVLPVTFLNYDHDAGIVRMRYSEENHAWAVRSIVEVEPVHRQLTRDGHDKNKTSPAVSKSF